MGIIQDIESIRYRFVLDLIKQEEIYDKKRSIISGNDAFNLFYGRYQLMQQVLLPLKQKLGDEIDVTDIKFVINEDNTGIIVKYVKDEQLYLLAISNIDYEDINVIASDLRVQNDEFIEANRKIILRTFRNISDNSLDEEIVLKSTSGKFVVKDNCDLFNIRDIDGKVFSIDEKYSTYTKTKTISVPSKLVCNYPKLSELLNNEENIKLIHEHLHIYEENLPKELIKKLTYR